MKLIDAPAIQIIQIPMGRGLLTHELQQKHPEFAWTYEPGFGEWEIQLGTDWCLIYRDHGVVVKHTLWEDFWPQAELFIRLIIKPKPKNVCTDTSLVSLITCRCFREYDVLIRDTKNCRCPPSPPFNWGDCSREEPQCHDPS